MSSVNIDDIDLNYRYVKTPLNGSFENPEDIIGNLEKLYEYIDKKEDGNPNFKYGKAYKKILKVARLLVPRKKYVISKRQVANLVKVYKSENVYYVKIPYTADYIFRAIFLILDTYKESGENDIPEDIVGMFGKLRRECFYKYPCWYYDQVYGDELDNMKRNLYKDLISEQCSLGRKV